MTSAPLYFEITPRQGTDQNGKDVLQTVLSLAGIPIMHNFGEIDDLEDEAAISTLALEKRDQVATDFALVLRDLLASVEQPRVVVPAQSE